MTSEGDVPMKIEQRKYVNAHESPPRDFQSEDISHEPRSGEIEMCRRVGCSHAGVDREQNLITLSARRHRPLCCALHPLIGTASDNSGLGTEHVL